MLNKVILMGRLVADPDLRQTTNNVSMCRFTIALDRPYNAASGGEKQTDFITIIAWRQTAEFVSRYFSKGKMIIVEGALRNDNYTDKDGVKHYSMNVQADKVSFGESKAASEGYSGGSGQQNNFAQPAYKNAEPAQQTSNESVQIGDLDDFEEILSDGDVPF
ncbi:MAG: single-stranded DNA-binding protein [Oscillospiraceae bacterium]|nr:single-stranded DNA-binding protein [Oscillospiraceae bacterium]